MLVSLAVAALLISPIAHNGNGIQEDDPRWDCTTMGNFICGRIEGHSVVSQSDAPGRITYTFDNGSTFTCNDWHNGQECTGVYEIDSRS